MMKARAGGIAVLKQGRCALYVTKLLQLSPDLCQMILCSPIGTDGEGGAAWLP